MKLRNKLTLLLAASAIFSCTGQQEKQNATTTSQVETTAVATEEIPAQDSSVVISNEVLAEDAPVQDTQTNSPQNTAQKEKTAPSASTHQSATQKAVTKARTADKNSSAPAGRIGLTFLKEGEKKYFEERQMSIHFKGITEDSRCPAGVNCIWEGVAVAEITFDGNEAAPQTVRLASTPNAGNNYQHTVTYNGFKISLKSVAPHSVENKASLKGKYEIGLLFESGNSKGGGIDPRVIRSAPDR